MAKQKVICWEVVLTRPGLTSQQTVQPVAKDKLQASHRAAHMLGVSWRENVRYMEIRGPYKATAGQVREWNRAYPQWSTERDALDERRGKTDCHGRGAASQ